MTDKPNIKILLVDDEETLLEYLSKRLLKEGLTVKAAFSGEEAVKVAGGENFDVAVVDLKMPGIDGVETQKRLKEVQPFLQCIVLTGHGSVESALESGQQDAFQYLLKPIDYDTLLIAIKDAFQRKTDIENAIVDKNCRIGRNVKIVTQEGGDDRDASEVCLVRDGIPIVVKDSVITDGWKL